MAYRIFVNDKFITIQAAANDAAFLSLLETVSGIYTERKRDTYFCSLRKLPEILAHGRNIHGPEQLTGQIRDLYIEELNRRENTKRLIENGPDSTSDFLWRHQLLGVDLAKYNRRFGFFYDTRTGKTLMTLQIIYNALVGGHIKRAIVICPSSIIDSWLADAEKFFPALKVVGYYGSEATKRRALTTPSHVVIWSMEQAVSNLETLKAIKPGMVVVDESSKLKNYKAQISKAMLEYSALIPSWYLLSATPAPNNEAEYYIQMRTIDRYVFNPIRGHFVSKYFNNISRSVNYEKLVIKPEMKKEFMDTIKEYAIYVDQTVMPTTKSEWIIEEYDMPASTREIYHNVAKELFAQLNDDTMIVVSTQAAARAKLDQITKGFILDTESIKNNKINRKLGLEETEEVIRIPGDKSRLECLDRILNRHHGEQAVIWAYYRQEFEDLKEHLNNKAHYIPGGLDVATKTKYINDFRAGKVQYLVCHPMALGMGINLTVAHIAIYYCMTDSWEALKQSSERIRGHSSIQTKDCIYYVIIARDTVNSLIYKNVTNKRDASFGLLDYLQAEALQ